ncbi:hypothetical protein [Nesterenkonia ebinurensis]|uniref:hypothetical protein n=1 Tax=Nesterenkonia ebinurensis TaxID=2608252 RepID=UPI00123D6A5E|nr:hypothetical protein [Nesterenkonia ebinurensis]
MYFGVEQDVERHPWLCVNHIVIGDDEAVEEGLVGDPAQRIIDAHVDRVTVTGQGQAVIEVGTGLIVFDLAGLDAGVEERDLSVDDEPYWVLFPWVTCPGFCSPGM